MEQAASRASPHAVVSILGLVLAFAVIFGSPWVSWPQELYLVQVVGLCITVLIAGIGLYRTPSRTRRFQVDALLFGWSCSMQMAAIYFLEATLG